MGKSLVSCFLDSQCRIVGNVLRVPRKQVAVSDSLICGDGRLSGSFLGYVWSPSYSLTADKY